MFLVDDFGCSGAEVDFGAVDFVRHRHEFILLHMNSNISETDIDSAALAGLNVKITDLLDLFFHMLLL